MCLVQMTSNVGPRNFGEWFPKYIIYIALKITEVGKIGRHIYAK